VLTLRNIAGIANPPYLFQPFQIVNRVWRELAWRSRTRETVRLPWGLEIIINPQEAIGHNITTRGLYDLAVTEALWRLTDPGELTVDVGANIGYTASILAVRAGPQGEVVCFEPHPEVMSRLRENADHWRQDGRCARITLHQLALGSGRGVATLCMDSAFQRNNGTARIVPCPEQSRHASFEVKLERLDSVLAAGQTISVIKLDAEGAELDIFEGMGLLLGGHRVRDIVFEEVAEFPAPTHKFLESAGYTVLGLQAGIFGVRCVAGAAPATPLGGDPPSYLATIEPKRACGRFRQPGWHSFGMLSRVQARG